MKQGSQLISNIHLELDEIKTENKMLKESLDKTLEEEKMMEYTLRSHKEELLQQVAFKHIFSIEGVGWGGGGGLCLCFLVPEIDSN